MSTTVAARCERGAQTTHGSIPANAAVNRMHYKLEDTMFQNSDLAVLRLGMAVIS